jgi:hypothetical protein
MRTITYTDAILGLRPEATFYIFNNDYSTLKWYDTVQTAPTEQEIIDKITELEEVQTSLTYQESRKYAYPTIGDQLDMIWHAIDSGNLNTSSTFYTSLKTIKERYPKP